MQNKSTTSATHGIGRQFSPSTTGRPPALPDGQEPSAEPGERPLSSLRYIDGVPLWGGRGRTARESAYLRPRRSAPFESIPIRPQRLAIRRLRLQLEHLTLLDHLGTASTDIGPRNLIRTAP
jgi:hypothetical protein